MTEKKDKLVRGSIRVFKDACFYEEREVQQINISYGNMSSILHATTIPTGLKEIFKTAGIDFEPDIRLASRLNSGIDGLQLDNIESAGDDHLRLKFSGLTETELKDKLKNATKWLKGRDIPFGEQDGKVACIFKCLTTKQLEIGESKDN